MTIDMEVLHHINNNSNNNSTNSQSNTLNTQDVARAQLKSNASNASDDYVYGKLSVLI
jgi:hypothetical protein